MTWLVGPMEERDRPLLAAMMTARIRANPLCPRGLEFPQDLVPPYGVVARETEDGPPMAAATLLYDPAARMAFCGWCMASPALKGRRMRAAIRAVLSWVPVYADGLGAWSVMSCFGRRSVNRMLDDMGWIPGDKGADTKIRFVKGG
jgi:hypothetical protein